MSFSQPSIAVLALQGDFEKHLQTLTRLGVRAVPARLPDEIAQADGIILPGGESTTIGKMMARTGTDAAIKQAARAGIPIYGTCAGLILLARRIAEGTQERGGQPTLGLLDITVARNAFGRQVDSFEVALTIPLLGDAPLRTAFIRAPSIIEAGPGVEILARHDGRIVFVRQGNVWGSAFHPELADDDRIHQEFIRLTTQRRGDAA